MKWIAKSERGDRTEELKVKRMVRWFSTEIESIIRLGGIVVGSGIRGRFSQVKAELLS